MAKGAQDWAFFCVFALIIALDKLLSMLKVVQKELQEPELKLMFKMDSKLHSGFILCLNAIAELRWELNNGGRSPSLG
jgi:hypothetical protein